MKKLLIILMVVAMASFLFVGCLGVTPPVNTAPVITTIPDATITVGDAFTYAVVATDPDVGDVLTYSLTVAPLTPTMVIDAATGAITWPIATEGTFGVIVVVTDEGGLIDFEGFTITVSVIEPEPEPELVLVGIEVDPKTIDLIVGESDTIDSVTATYEFRGYEVDIPLGECTFLSTDDGVATVLGTTVTAEKVGIATIIVSHGGKVDTIAVTVIAVEVDHIVVDPDEMKLVVGTGGILSEEIGSVIAYYNYGAPDIILLGECDYESSEPFVAEVEVDDNIVTVTATATNPGIYEAIITVTYEGKTDTIDVEVTVLGDAAAPSAVVLGLGGTTPVGGVTNVAIPLAGDTDTTGEVIGWVAATDDEITFTVTDTVPATSTITIGVAPYTNGDDYKIPSTDDLTIIVTTTEADKTTCERTFIVTVAAL